MNIETLQVTTPSDREIVLQRAFAAPRRLVFDALTRPELVQRWLLGPEGWTMPLCEIDLRVGGRFRYVWRNAQGNEFGMHGVYREIAPPERLVHTELFDPGPGMCAEAESSGGEAIVTTLLVEQGGKTTLRATVLYPSREVRDAVIKSGMERGVAASYDRLAELLASPAAHVSDGGRAEHAET